MNFWLLPVVSARDRSNEQFSNMISTGFIRALSALLSLSLSRCSFTSRDDDSKTETDVCPLTNRRCLNYFFKMATLLDLALKMWMWFIRFISKKCKEKRCFSPDQGSTVSSSLTHSDSIMSTHVHLLSKLVNELVTKNTRVLFIIHRTTAPKKERREINGRRSVRTFHLLATLRRATQTLTRPSCWAG